MCFLIVYPLVNMYILNKISLDDYSKPTYFAFQNLQN